MLSGFWPAAASEPLLTVDLARCEVGCGGTAYPVPHRPVAARGAAIGCDEIEQTLAHGADIARFEQAQRECEPWLYAPATVLRTAP